MFLPKFTTAIAKRILSPRISKINLAVTYRCNYRCKTCNIWKYPSQRENEITPIEFIKTLRKNNLIWVSLTGGEPSLREDYRYILRTSLEFALLTSSVTNGSLPDKLKEDIEFAYSSESNNKLVYSVSIEGDRDTENNLKGVKNAWDNSIQCIENLIPLQKKYNFNLGIEFLVSKETINAVKNVANLAKYYNIDVTYTFYNESNYYHNIGLNKEEYLNIPNTKLSLSSIMNKIYINRYKHYGLNGNINCVAGQYSLFVDPYCNVSPCLLRPENIICNLRKMNYWLPEKIQIDKSHCKGCWTPCEAYTTILFRPYSII